MNPDSAIVVEGITKLYGDFRAVNDLTFDVQRGEIFALLGPNGSGKTTSIRMILDILKPDAGQIAVLGGVMTDSTKERIGYLPEERGLYQGVPALDIMIYLGRLKGMSEHDARQRSMNLLEQLELAEHATKKVGELSKGMQQKIQFAVTVLHDPELIIIDEPFSGLDPVNTLVVKALLQDMRDNGVAIVMSTHQMNQIEEMADRMLMIHQGSQQLYGAVDEIRGQYALHAIIVEGEGDWGTLPGVESIVPDENGRGSTLLRLAESATSDDVLGAIAGSPNFRIERFQRAVPNLNEIFIRVVEEQKP